MPSTESETEGKLLRTPKWPDAFPSVHGSRLVFGLNCGNTSLSWSLFDEVQSPIFHWFTKIPKEDEDAFLFYFLPTSIQFDFFGFSEETRRKGSVKNSTLCRKLLERRDSVVTVYMIASNPLHEAKAIELFEGLPAVVYRISKADLLQNDPQLSVYDTMGEDRIAGLMGARVCFPNRKSHLVIDGGTALTVTTICNDNKIGGVIGTGPRIKLSTMKMMTENLPDVTDAVLDNLLLNLGPRRLETFASNTVESMVACVSKETTLILTHYIQEWRKNLPDEISKDQTPVVVVCGGDGALLCRLLRPDHSGVIVTTPETTAFLQTGEFFDSLHSSAEPKTSNTSFQLVHIPQAIHFGIKYILQGQTIAKTPVNDVRSKLVGQRVLISDERGTIVSVNRAEEDNIADDLVSVYVEDSNDFVEINMIEIVGKCWLHRWIVMKHS